VVIENIPDEDEAFELAQIYSSMLSFMQTIQKGDLIERLHIEIVSKIYANGNRASISITSALST
jgi:hypothetical protein